MPSYGFGTYGLGAFGVGGSPSVSRVTLECLVEWGSFAAGTLAIAADDADTESGSIAADDADVAAGVMLANDSISTFAGTYDDISAMVDTVRIESGRDALLLAMLGGTATITGRDPAALFNYANAASPIAATIDDRMHPVQIRLARAGVWRSRFYGLTRRVTWSPSGRKGTFQIECVDLFYWLARAKPIIVGFGPTTTGAAIGLVLDTVRWLDPDARVLDVGDTIPDFYADGSKTALEVIGELLDAERGVFYMDGDGRAIYEDRHARLLRASEASLVDRMTHLEPEVDFDLIRNRVRVSRLDPATGEIAYTAEAVDSDSVERIGYADADPLETLYLESDAQADDLAAWMLPLVVEATGPIRDFAIDGRDDDLVDAILDLNLVDRLTLAESAGGSAGDFHVERHELTVGPGGRLSASYLLSKASVYTPLLIAEDDADTTSGSIATDDADVAAGTLVY